MFPQPCLIRTVQAHWSEQTAGTAPTIYPGARSDPAEAPAWFELWVDSWTDAPRRAAAPDLLAIAIVVHCFSRDPSDKSRVHALADAARQAFSGRRLPIIDDAAPTPHVVGWLSIHEHSAHDLTRHQAALGQPALQHVVVTFTAAAQQLS